MGLKKEVELDDLGIISFKKEGDSVIYSIEAFKGSSGFLTCSSVTNFRLTQFEYNLFLQIQKQFQVNKSVSEAPRETLYLFSVSLLRFRSPNVKIEALLNLHSLYGSLVDHVLFWVSNCYVELGDLKTALKYYLRPPLGSCSSHGTDCLLSLKYALKIDIDAMDVMSLQGPKLTKWGKENIKAVAEFLDIRLNELRKEKNRLLLEDCLEKNIWTGKYPLYNGSVFASNSDKLTIYQFSHYYGFVDLMRDAENTAREESGIPKVGEGWIAESELYYKLKKHYSHLKVEHHGKPPWLGKQHLDIYFPEVNIAVEYQGLQHDEPVDYFGGEEAFKLTVKRDKKKFRLCEKNNCQLYYVKANYKFHELTALIDNLLKTKK